MSGRKRSLLTDMFRQVKRPRVAPTVGQTNGFIDGKGGKQGLTNPLSGCPGQVKIFAGQVKKFFTCPEKCLNYIGKFKEFQGVLAEAIRRTSRSDFDLSSPG